ncbi:MFS transporter [Actinomadura madurae]|uniref:MFS transporter n=1 Tax=Actinomadura madurae TaxID=1993 RepID=UPI0020275DD7|nr:MFS transporter [Actinomadura madurae]MCP9969416.1 MFS transporter [Actinomadura madurae]MCP9981877.1 MFS transporter [Actinomadura madurae]MCQ0006598.1 MFS transporter [Actinomadura madurae]MCQ0018106.1 MFS transporter [Actinomadura madurae]URM98165.1 MFS transporter [Actinomadura madurae]
MNYASLLGLMAVPGMPLPVLCVLLAVMTALSGPYKAAQLALLADVLVGGHYVTGLSIRQMTIQSAQIAGFVGGGVLAQAVTPSAGLAVDAFTFAIAAVLVRLGVRHRPAPAPAAEGARRAGALEGAALVWRDPRLRSLAGLSWLAGCYIAPEGLAAPYADALGAGSAVAVGVIMASDPVGSVIGALVWGRFVPGPVRDRSVGVLALATGLPLAACVLRPGLVVSTLLFAASGALATGYQMQVNVTFVRTVPDHFRARGLGVMSAGLITVQGLGVLVSGAVASVIGPAQAVAGAGAAGMLIGMAPARLWFRTRQRKGGDRIMRQSQHF